MTSHMVSQSLDMTPINFKQLDMTSYDAHTNFT